MSDDNHSNAIIPISSGSSRQSDSPDAKRSLKTLPYRLKFMVMETGDVIEMRPDQPIMIGRRGSGKHVDIDLTPFQAHDMGVSRHHARIEPAGDRLMVKDLNSVNGTTLNGEQLTPEYVYEIHHGDVLKIGRLHLKIYFLTHSTR